jgi:hypothetical protein
MYGKIKVLNRGFSFKKEEEEGTLFIKNMNYKNKHSTRES